MNYQLLSVETAMQRADQVGAAVPHRRPYPTFVINGKYVADASRRRLSGAIDGIDQRSCRARAQALDLKK